MITIRLLADTLDAIPILIKWFREQWPDYHAGISPAQMEQDFLSDASRDRLPIRLIAFDSSDLAGTIVLRAHRNETLPKDQPELGGLYVAVAHRGRGIATLLVQAGMELARNHGYKTVFATTVVAAGILESLGWEFIKTVIHQGGELSLYRCEL